MDAHRESEAEPEGEGNLSLSDVREKQTCSMEVPQIKELVAGG